MAAIWLTALAAFAAVAVTVGVVFACNLWVWLDTRGRIFEPGAAVPERQVALVLGTSPAARGGGKNVYFAGRVQTAAALLDSGTVQHLLLSGANPSTAYNEPRAMQAALEARGVVAAQVTHDYAGFRTLDSLVRAREIFEVVDPLIVSQRTHAARALFIAKRRGLRGAIAVAAPTVPRRRSIRTEVRELGARVKAVIDLYVLRKQPKFLGEAEPITPIARQPFAETKDPG